jgi:hypothetical protein
LDQSSTLGADFTPWGSHFASWGEIKNWAQDVAILRKGMAQLHSKQGDKTSL